jgi:hypothetical protein
VVNDAKLTPYSNDRRLIAEQPIPHHRMGFVSAFKAEIHSLSVR